MFKRFLTTGAAALLLSLATTPFAQQAAAPAASAPASAAPAAAPAAADASEGKIAYYGRKFAGRKTASGERFNPGAMTMAHKSLPFGTLVRVTNLKNKRSLVLRVNDRGPMQADRIGDVSLAAAKKLGFVRSGLTDARLEVVGSKGGKKVGKKARR